MRGTHARCPEMMPRGWMIGVIQDNRLSADARALIIFVGSRPARWRYSVEECRRVLLFGRQKYQKIMREAKDAGYVTVTQPKDGKGRLEPAILTVHYTPRAENQTPENATPRDDLKAFGPRVENQPSRARIMRAPARVLRTVPICETFRVLDGGRNA